MFETIITAAVSAAVTGGITLIGILIANGKAQAVTETKLEELTREVRKHNNFAERMPVVEEKLKVINHRIDDLEGFHRDGIGYHYYVRQDGSVWRGRLEDTIGAHTIGYNYSSIGICFEGNFETDVMPAEQLAAGRELLADILCRYPGIEISAHRDKDSTACPGKNFPQELLNFKEEIMDIKKFVENLTDEQAYEIITKAQRHAATLPVPDWAKSDFQVAIYRGITDGTNPMQLVPRYQAAIMVERG